MVGMQVEKEMLDKVFEAVEHARKSGKIKKGTNEVTKAIERGTAKLVVVAKDVSPPEIVMHIPALCKEKGIACVEAPSREELGAVAGIAVSTVSIAIVDEGDAKNIIKSITEELLKE